MPQVNDRRFSAHDRLERAIEQCRRDIVASDHIARRYERRIAAGKKGLTGYRDSFRQSEGAAVKKLDALVQDLRALERRLPRPKGTQNAGWILVRRTRSGHRGARH